jgi:hypothetical protein
MGQHAPLVVDLGDGPERGADLVPAALDQGEDRRSTVGPAGAPGIRRR